MSVNVFGGDFIRLGRLVFVAMVVTAVAGLSACGSDANSGGVSESSNPIAEVDAELAEVSRILAPEKLFAFDDYVAAGWKNSKQFGTETVPESTDVWYGFYAGKDIEIRFYDSHEVAKTVGFESAGAAVDLSYGSDVAKNAAGGSAATKYKAFAVVGNTVLLCELSIESCMALFDALEG